MPDSHTAHDSLFATTEQLQMPHTAVFQAHAVHDIQFVTTEQLQMPHTAVCQSLMQPMTFSLPQLNSYRCHTQLYASPSYSP